MKKISIMIIMIFVLLSLIPKTVLAEDLVFNMRDALWGEQGSRGWYYYSFHNGEYKMIGFSEDGARFLTEEFEYLEIYSNGAHPPSNSNASAVRGFDVMYSGEVEITWEVAPTNGSYYMNDGVAIKVMRNQDKVFPKDKQVQIVSNPIGKPYPSGGDNDYIATPEVFVFTTEVTGNDFLYFHLFNNENAAFDRTRYDITIKYLSVEKETTPEPTPTPTLTPTPIPEPTTESDSEFVSETISEITSEVTSDPVSDTTQESEYSGEDKDDDAQRNSLVYIIIVIVLIAALAAGTVVFIKKKKSLTPEN